MLSTPQFNSNHILYSIRQIPSSLITSQEKLILFILFSCMNIDNETWYSMKQISEFCSMGRSTFKRHIKHLKNNNFITIKSPEHYTHKVTNIYQLNIDFIMSFYPTKDNKKSLTVDKSGSDLNPDNEVGVQIEPRSGSNLNPGRGPNRATKLYTKKNNKCVREKKSLAHPTHTLFQPSEKHKLLAKELGLDFDYQLEKFLHVKKGVKNDWAFSNWLKESKDFMLKESGSLPPPQPEPSKITHTHIQPDDFVKAHPETVMTHLEKVWSTIQKPNREVK